MTNLESFRLSAYTINNNQKYRPLAWIEFKVVMILYTSAS